MAQDYGAWRRRWQLVRPPMCSPAVRRGGRPPGHRADRPRVHGAHGSGVRDLRAHRAATDPVRAGRGLPAVSQPAARDRLHPVRRGQASSQADQRRRAGLRSVPLRTWPPPVRDMRQDCPDRCPGQRQQPRRVRELLPDAHGRLHGLRATPGMQLRGHPADLPDLLAAVHGRVRPLRAGRRRPSAGQRDRSAAPAIRPPCAGEAPAAAAASSGSWSPRPDREPASAPTARD